MPNPNKAVIIVENSYVPLDVRVWQEATTLRNNGWDVKVICPEPSDTQFANTVFTGDDMPVDLEGVSVYYFPLPSATKGVLSYFAEYFTAFFAIIRLCWQIWRRERFDILHICNPPDMFFPIALVYRFLGAGIIFDHHDLFPEFVIDRYRGVLGKLFYGIARVMEYLTFLSAHIVVTVNQSYRQLAIERGNQLKENVVVVRNGPKAAIFSPVGPNPELKKEFPILVSYVGIMGYDDGILELIEVIRYIVMDLGRSDILFSLVGDGAMREHAMEQIRTWGIDDFVSFPGLISDNYQIRQYLSTSDICLSPEPLTPLNEKSTFIKVGEYMAIGKPVVAFDLDETRWTARDAAYYVKPGDIRAFGQAITELADDPEKRRVMGEYGRERFLDILSWEHQENNLLLAYDMARNREPVS